MRPGHLGLVALVAVALGSGACSGNSRGSAAPTASDARVSPAPAPRAGAAGKQTAATSARAAPRRAASAARAAPRRAASASAPAARSGAGAAASAPAARFDAGAAASAPAARFDAGAATSAAVPNRPGMPLFHLDGDQIEYRPPRHHHHRHLHRVGLILRSTPPAAMAAVDGVPVGRTPAYFQAPADGKPHDFTFVLPGYEMARYRFVVLRPGIVHATLRRLPLQPPDAGAQPARAHRRRPR